MPRITFDRRPEGVSILHSTFGSSTALPSSANIRSGSSVTLKRGRIRYGIRVVEARPGDLFVGNVDDIEFDDSIPAGNEDASVLPVSERVEFGLEAVHACMHE